MASTILTLLAVHGFRTTISALTSTQTTTTKTTRPKYAFIRSKKIVKSTTTANEKYVEKVRHGRPEVYRLVGAGREEEPETGLAEERNTIDVWRRVEDVYGTEEGTVKERSTMKMPLDRGLRQVVRNLREGGSSQVELKESRRSKKKERKDTTSGRTARRLRRTNSAMSDGEDERLQGEGSNTRSSTSSTAFIREYTNHTSSRKHQRASANDPQKSLKTTQKSVPSTMQASHVSQSQRRKSHPSVSSPPFGQPTMSPEQSANFVFGNPDSNAAASILTANSNVSTIRTVAQDGEHAMSYQRAKKRSPGGQFLSDQTSALTIKGKPQTMTRIPGSPQSKSSQYMGSILDVKADGSKWIQEGEEREALLEMDEEGEAWEEE